MTRYAPRYRRLFPALLLLAAASLQGQTTATLPMYNRNVVFLDATHGGTDNGAHIANGIDEKNVTLAFSQKLRSLLQAKGLTVVSTRDGDTALTSDQRAEMANHARPIACLLLHATSSGSGVYLATSSLPPDAEPRAVLPWETAQATYLSQSLSLLEGVTSALAGASLKPVTLQSSVPPIDSLTCPAVLVEFAPKSGTAVTDDGYQQQLAEALTGALLAWKTTFDPPKPVDPDAASSDPMAPKAAPRPKIKPPVAAPAPPSAPGAPLRSIPPVGGPR